MMIDYSNLPRYAIWRNQKVRVVDYDKDRNRRRPFRILNKYDQYVDAARDELIFLPNRKKEK